MVNTLVNSQNGSSFDVAALLNKVQYHKWEPISITELCNNYLDEAAIELAAEAESASFTFLGQFPQSLANAVLSPKKFSEGNSGSRVESLSPAIGRGKQQMNADGEEYVGFILKSNKTAELNDCEMEIYKLIGDDSVAKYAQAPKDPEKFKEFVKKLEDEFHISTLRVKPGDLLIEDLGKNTLESEIHMQQIKAPDLDYLQDYSDAKGTELARMVSKYDSKLNSLMKTPEKAKLGERLNDLNKYEKLEKLFGVSKEDAKNNYYLLNMIRSLPGASKEIIQKLGPVIDSLNDSYNKTKMWSIDLKFDNVLYQNDKAKFSDLNYVREASMQEIDAVMLDAVIPVRELLTERLALYGPWNEENKRKIIDTRLNAYETETGEKIDRADYMAGRFPASFYISIRRASQAVEKLSKAKSYIQINKQKENITGYLTNAFSALGRFGSEKFNDCAYFLDVTKEINRVYECAIEAACPAPIRKGLNIILSSPFNGFADSLVRSGKALELQAELEKDYSKQSV